jgi:hypothetical protein
LESNELLASQSARAAEADSLSSSTDKRSTLTKKINFDTYGYESRQGLNLP